MLFVKHLFLIYPDQKEADRETDNHGEVREGEEAARAEEVWQEGGYLFDLFTNMTAVKGLRLTLF